MADSKQKAVEQLVAGVVDPWLDQTLAEANAVEAVQVSDGQVNVDLCLPYACALEHPQLRERIARQLEGCLEGRTLQVRIRQQIQSAPGGKQLPGLVGVRNIIAIASGKGGVGKSTTTTNLALALHAQGARVGVLDADIYGPSQGMMLGVPAGTRPDSAEDKYFLPVEAQGIQVMSMSFLVDENTPMVWRGPMVSGALQQLLTQTLWQDLDYLLIDMPPGTGDIQLTLSQRVAVTGAIIVTTPQDIALLDARKGIEMFRKVDIPVLGVIENMSTHVCSHCGHEEAIFGAGGGEKLAQDYGCELLGQLPLAMEIRQQVDSGRGCVITDPDGPHARRYLQIACRVSALLARNREQGAAVPNISIMDD